VKKNTKNIVEQAAEPINTTWKGRVSLSKKRDSIPFR